MPPEGTIVARCDQIADITKRNYTGVIEVAAGNKFKLKVLSREAQVVYEKLTDEVIDTWIISQDTLVYQERLSNNLITYVKLSQDGGESNEVTLFKLPADMVVEDHITASMEPFVQAHRSEDKQALRNLIKSEVDNGAGVKQPTTHMMAQVDDKLAIVTAKEVLYFRPELLMAEELSKDGTI